MRRSLLIAQCNDTRRVTRRHFSEITRRSVLNRKDDTKKSPQTKLDLAFNKCSALRRNTFSSPLPRSVCSDTCETRTSSLLTLGRLKIPRYVSARRFASTGPRGSKRTGSSSGISFWTRLPSLLLRSNRSFKK